MISEVVIAFRGRAIEYSVDNGVERETTDNCG